MIFTLLISLNLALSLSILLATTPLILGLWILLLTFSIARTFYFFLSSWLAIFTALIYIGGLLVIFAYFVALAPNQVFEIKLILISSTFLTSSFLALLYFSTPVIPTFLSTSQPTLYISSLLSMTNSSIFITLAFILLLALIAVVKITSSPSGPLRPWNFL